MKGKWMAVVGTLFEVIVFDGSRCRKISVSAASEHEAMRAAQIQARNDDHVHQQPGSRQYRAVSARKKERSITPSFRKRRRGRFGRGKRLLREPAIEREDCAPQCEMAS